MRNANLGIIAALATMITPQVQVQSEGFDFARTQPLKSRKNKKCRSVGEKFAEQYQKRYASIPSTKPSNFLGFRKVRKFIPEIGMSVWVKV